MKNYYFNGINISTIKYRIKLLIKEDFADAKIEGEGLSVSLYSRENYKMVYKMLEALKLTPFKIEIVKKPEITQDFKTESIGSGIFKGKEKQIKIQIPNIENDELSCMLTVLKVHRNLIKDDENNENKELLDRTINRIENYETVFKPIHNSEDYNTLKNDEVPEIIKGTIDALKENFGFSHIEVVTNGKKDN